MGFDPSTTKPEIDFPGDEPPADLVIEDLTDGDGAEAGAGDTVSAHYVGVAHSTGEEFDASWNRGAPLDFRLGVGQVIPGWDQGIVGMKVGGRRRLTIPAAPGLRRPRRRRRDQAGRDADLRRRPRRTCAEHTPPALSRPARSGRLSAVRPPAAYRPAAAAARNAAGSSSSPRPIVDSAHRGGAQRLVEAVDRHLDQRSAGRRCAADQRRAPAAHQRAERAVGQRRHGHVGRRQRRPARMPCGCGARCRGAARARVGLRDAQRGDGAAAEDVRRRSAPRRPPRRRSPTACRCRRCPGPWATTRRRPARRARPRAGRCAR